LIAGKLSPPNYTGKPSDSFIKVNKVSNPEDTADKEKDKKLQQTSMRESTTLNKQGSMTKTGAQQYPATTSQPQIPAPSTADTTKKSQRELQNKGTNSNAKITLSPSKVNIRMAESHAVVVNR